MSRPKAPAVRFEAGERVELVGWFGAARPGVVVERTAGAATLVELDDGPRMLVGNHNLRRPTDLE